MADKPEDDTPLGQMARILNSPGMQALARRSNSPGMQALARLSNSPGMQEFSRRSNSPGMQELARRQRDLASRLGMLASADTARAVSVLSRAMGGAPTRRADKPPAPSAAAVEAPKEPETPEALLIAEQWRREDAGEPLMDRVKAQRWLREAARPRYPWKTVKPAQSAAWEILGLDRPGPRLGIIPNRDTRPGNPDMKSGHRAK
jgi:hypothetical protein